MTYELTYELTDEMIHSGIKGMRWGKRKAKTSSIKSTKNKVPTGTKKPRRIMTDTELRDRINRIQLENQYRQLTTPIPSATKKMVSDILMNAFKQTATAYAAKYMGKGITSLIKVSSPSQNTTPPTFRNGFI